MGNSHFGSCPTAQEDQINITEFIQTKPVNGTPQKMYYTSH
jgi:hypothetical protein